MAMVSLAVAGGLRVAAEVSACPSAAAVEANVASLIGEPAETSTAEIVDLGDRYRVVVGDSVRELVDGERRCEERARAAAVFIVLVLDRPREAPAVDRADADRAAADRADADRVVVDRVVAPPVTERVVEPVASSSIELQLALLATLPFGAFDGTSPGFAGAARAAWTSGSFGVAAGIGFAPAITLAFDAATARVRRVPLDANLRVHHAFGAIDAAAELGAVAAILSVANDAPDAGEGGLRLELGARAAIFARAELGAIAPFFIVETAVIPAPYEVASYRDGSVGRTPALWLALGAGISLRVD